ncbi:MAG: hypothetical protein VX906_04475 [Candidatus Thermoplasmatota archaeon]|nr:hypothetical protein [Candidatus Thermoplasmatota archaeon]MED5486350.1 hypothetical protein [Candidatus Thermoplasmatota archaeon]|tara:strand:+ start:762 stop:2009 length:1248 start_codon:yes stop_codon:yes gene_type:complete
MAEDVAQQEEGLITLHLRTLRKEWRVVGLQLVASIALIWLFLTLTRIFGYCHPDYIASGEWCPALDHTLTLAQIEMSFSEGGAFEKLPIPNWVTGLGNQGDGRYYVPIILCMVIAAGWVALNFQPPARRRKITLALLGSMILFLAGMFILTWTFGMITQFELYWPFGNADDSLNHANHLIWPLSVYIQLLIVLFYLAPVLFGLMGIWGLSKRMINWSMAYILVFLGLYALLSYEGIVALLSSMSNPNAPGLNPLPTQIGETDTLGGLISGQVWELLLVAVLLMLYSETAHATIRFLEYAFRLPESCKKDPEYVRQFQSILNTHMQHTVVVIFAVGFVTMLALKFDDLIIDVVGWTGSGQWSGQVKESLELRLTYGKVISAMLFLTFVAGLKYIVPWQRVSGLIEAALNKKGNSNP